MRREGAGGGVVVLSRRSRRRASRPVTCTGTFALRWGRGWPVRRVSRAPHSIHSQPRARARRSSRACVLWVGSLSSLSTSGLSACHVHRKTCAAGGRAGGRCDVCLVHRVLYIPSRARVSVTSTLSSTSHSGPHRRGHHRRARARASRARALSPDELFGFARRAGAPSGSLRWLSSRFCLCRRFDAHTLIDRWAVCAS